VGIIHNYYIINDLFRVLKFYPCGRFENTVLHIRSSHSEDTNMMTEENSDYIEFLVMLIEVKFGIVGKVKESFFYHYL